MSDIAVRDTDFSEFEAQFRSAVRVAPTRFQLRVRGWLIALAASLVLWAAIGVGIAAAIHALS